MTEPSSNIQRDIDLISKIEVIPNILEVVRKTTGMGFATIARVTDEKWVACAVSDDINFGLLPGDELVLESTFCNEVKQSRKLVVIDHVAEDETYSCHHTPLQYGFQSYISVPIILKDGQFFGTLCAIDTQPAALNNSHTIGMFNLFADLISFHIDAISRINFTEVRLAEELRTAELRDQFIAILGHDLRNPLGAILNASQLLLRIPENERVNRLAHIVEDASFRIKQLIENILDFAKGEMGGGIDLHIDSNVDLETSLNQVISELQLVNPSCVIERDFQFSGSFACDASRIAQLFSNLLANSIIHGDTRRKIVVRARAEEDQFTLSVANSGKKIAKEKLEMLFKPFSRGENKSSKNGLGLGLYIAQEIARAHGGSLKASSSDIETRFTLTLTSAAMQAK
ncbi:MAG: histidine kinase [Pedobacter sp.]|nr:histidine kinase [Pedobacter sp.]